MSNSVRCVVDASIAIKLFIEQEGSEQAGALFAELSVNPDSKLYVPELFYAECANVLWQCVRRANYPATEAKTSLGRLKTVGLQKVALSEWVSEALDIAIAHGISAYDACYVELAKRLEVPLVTADNKLIRALENTAYPVHSLTTF